MLQNNKKYEMKFDIATNFDHNLIEEISKYKTISWVYGKLNNDVIGGGRPSIILPKFNWSYLKKHIEICHRNHIKFNYLINALCLGNKEFQKNYNNKIVKLLDKLSEIDVDGVTVASPYLCHLVKKQYPHLFVSVSIYNQVKTLPQIKYWEEFGADEITLDLYINRDFDTLKNILNYTKNSNMIVRLLGNNVCLHGCPFLANHAVAHAHASRKGDYSTKFHIDYQLLKCYNLKIKNPTKLISAKWIRPEDVHYYEELCEEVGNNKLSIKLMERDKKTDWLLRVAKAYSTRSYDGNLLDITNFAGKGSERQQNHNLPMFIKAILGRYNLKYLIKYKDVALAPIIYLDNKKLDGFMKKFIGDYVCNRSICDDEDRINDQKKCLYCKKWALKAISFNEQERNDYINKSDDFIDDINASRLYYFFNLKKKSRLIG